MPGPLTQSQVSQFERDGFLPVEGLLSDDELERFRESAAQAQARRLQVVAERSAPVDRAKRSLKLALRAAIGDGVVDRVRTLIPRLLGAQVGRQLVAEGAWGFEGTNQSPSDPFYARVYLQVFGLAREDERLRSCALDPRLGQIAAQLLSVDAVRLYHDQALTKRPGDHYTAWHLDAPFWSFSSSRALTMWIALDDVTPESGCLSYLPGTHLTASYDRKAQISKQFDALLDLYPKWRALTPVQVPCRAGTIVFHHGLTAHSAGPNTTARDRRAFACSFMADGVTFNGQRDVMSLSEFHRMRVGDRLDDDARYPLVWSAR